MNTASTLVRSLSRVAFRSTNVIKMAAPRHFSQSAKGKIFPLLSSVHPKVIPVLSVTPELQQALSREIEAEQQLSKENLQGSIAPTFPGFAVTTKEAEVRLTKRNGNEEWVSALKVFDDEFMWFLASSSSSTSTTLSIWRTKDLMMSHRKA